MKLPEEERLRRAKTRAKNAREKLDVASRLEEATTDVVKRMAGNPAFFRFMAEGTVGVGAAALFDTPDKFAALVALPFAPLAALQINLPGGVHIGFDLNGFERGVASTIRRMYGLTLDPHFPLAAQAMHAGLVVVLLELAHEFVRALGAVARENLADIAEAVPG